MEEEGVVEHAAHLGETVIGPALRELAERHPSVGEVRGLGIFWALELVRNKETREPLVPYNAAGEANAPMAAFGAACKKGGLWPLINMNRTHVVPPCNITARTKPRAWRSWTRRCRWRTRTPSDLRICTVAQSVGAGVRMIRAVAATPYTCCNPLQAMTPKQAKHLRTGMHVSPGAVLRGRAERRGAGRP